MYGLLTAVKARIAHSTAGIIATRSSDGERTTVVPRSIPIMLPKKFLKTVITLLFAMNV